MSDPRRVVRKIDREQVINRLLEGFTLEQLDQFATLLADIQSTTRYGAITTVISSNHIDAFKVEKSYKV